MTTTPACCKVVALLLIAAMNTVNAQIGVTLCACQPTTYTFTFNFNQTCQQQDLAASPGVIEDDCFIGSFIEDIDETVPVAVSSIQILELDENLQVLAFTPITGDFRSGDSFTYTSILDRPRDTLVSEGAESNIIPRGLQLLIRGRNQFDEFIDNTWIVIYSDECNIAPILFEGQSAGWTILSDIGQPQQLTCPFAPTTNPVIVPSVQPTISSAPSTRPSTTMQSSSLPTIALPSVAPTILDIITIPAECVPMDLVEINGYDLHYFVPVVGKGVDIVGKGSSLSKGKGGIISGKGQAKVDAGKGSKSNFIVAGKGKGDNTTSKSSKSKQFSGKGNVSSKSSSSSSSKGVATGKGKGAASSKGPKTGKGNNNNMSGKSKNESLYQIKKKQQHLVTGSMKRISYSSHGDRRRALKSEYFDSRIQYFFKTTNEKVKKTSDNVFSKTTQTPTTNIPTIQPSILEPMRNFVGQLITSLPTTNSAKGKQQSLLGGTSQLGFIDDSQMMQAPEDIPVEVAGVATIECPVGFVFVPLEEVYHLKKSTIASTTGSSSRSKSSKSHKISLDGKGRGSKGKGALYGDDDVYANHGLQVKKKSYKGKAMNIFYKNISSKSKSKSGKGSNMQKSMSSAAGKAMSSKGKGKRSGKGKR